MRRWKLFRAFTVAAFATSVWTAWANVLSDDAAVRAKARAAADEAAGCSEACRLEGLSGDRGMLEERLAYDYAEKGRYVVVCRRAFVIAGEHACVVAERPAGAPPGAKK